MPSKSWKAFGENTMDIARLLNLHAEIGGQGQGRRYGLEVLNKSAIVLITSYWEAYCEDIAAEALQHIVTHAETADALTKELKKQIAKELKNNPDELAMWQISDDGWRDVLKARLAKMQEERNRKLNTPKTEQIDDLFRSALGISSLSSCWRWAGMGAPAARAKLEKYVSLRGAIAHRGSAARSVKKSQVTDYFGFIKKIASKTGGNVKTHVKKITNKPLW